MTKLLAALVLLSTSVAHADVNPFARYFDYGVKSYARLFADNCVTDLAPAGASVDHLAGELMLSPGHTRDFLKRLRHALDATHAEGVVITGPRRHRMFAGELQLELKVITGPGEQRLNNPALRSELELMRADLIENSVFLKHFGARAFQKLSNVYVIASGLEQTPDLVPFAEDITALRGQLGRDLIELENVHRRYDILSAQNIFGKIAATACADATLDDFVRLCLPVAYRRIFRSVEGAINFAAGADTTIIMKSSTPNRKAWFASLNERGYRNIYSVAVDGTLRTMMPRMRDAGAAPRARRTAPDQPASAHH